MSDNVNGRVSAPDGEEIFRRLAPENARAPWETLADFAPALGAEVRSALGAVVGRPGLDLRTRQLVTVGVLAAIGGCEPQLQFHVGGALRAGATRTEVIETITQVYLYAGFPRAINAVQVARRAFEDTPAT
jgi:4-carboxymuconolactone decarboxylase